MFFKTIRKFLELVKFSHTVFALPFALISVILAFQHLSVNIFSSFGLETVCWVILAMVGARSGAMGFNRLVDRKWDAQNPRTANRPSVTGVISPLQISIMVGASFALLVFAAWKLNPLAFKLSPAAIFLVCFYSFCKRFTSLSHFFLGFAIGSAPIAGWIAVTGSISFTSLLIGLSVLTWIAGFDILYSLQDMEFDNGAALFSMPTKLGVDKSLLVAKASHLVTVVLWLALGKIENLGAIFDLGIFLCAIFLIWEHRLVNKNDLTRINMAFFNLNAIISITIFVTLGLDILINV